MTSATSGLGRTVAALLGPDHDLVLTDLTTHTGGSTNVTACDLGDDDSTDRLVDGIDAIVHIGYGGHFASASELLDVHTRCTYNLLTAARSAGVGRFVNLSTLRLLDDYPEYLTVTENWRSTPGVEPVILSAHLTEYVCREFGREGGIKIANLRLGFPLVEGDTAAAAGSGDSAALASDDLSAAISAALTADLGANAQSTDAPHPVSFRTIHVQSPIPGGRFLLKGAASILGLWEGQGVA
ncbi:MAG: NAD-dependent epimerase/dehydratase family protein [Dehalococcoidia bacterium]|nr:NAD-dependent epimerase/dehydratase family protein [Dehalococcoidia bacterium]